ncbi:fused MFS/spermidine synthase [Yoonia sp.]|uniref:fused MFS/spermidine synthase n=1 Tax=Yoonia sp. TaxID=2212373 RepID=UPI0019F51BF1|nr:fused MFS/spermidine synthase [Yoonia sp.]MBE0412890.1 fused MFS/spermidine synthase [Yoonia sp.]
MRTPPLFLLVLLQATVSAASLVVEIVAGRMLAPYVGMSLYTWTAIIAVVLAGFSAGHWWGGRLAERIGEDALRRTGWILLAAALSTAGASALLAMTAGPILNIVGHPVWSIVIIAMAVFFLPSLFAGVPAPVLTQIAISGQARSGRALGALFASGAIGAIAGTLLAGFVFISWLGSTGTLAVVTLAYIGTALICLRLGRARLVWPLLLALAALGLAARGAFASGPCDVESHYFCIRTVDVSADPAFPVRLMVIDHLVHGISAQNTPDVAFTEHAAMLQSLAALRAPRPDFSAFFIGGGTYSVPRALHATGAGPLTVAEIDPMVTQVAMRDFWFDPASATVLHEDARTALRGRPAATYDLIIGDAFTDIAVPAHLITQEFFKLVKSRLNPQGSYLMNVVDFEDRLDTLSAFVRTLQTTFPTVEVWTQQIVPDPGARMVFIVVAGDAPTRVDSFVAPAPDPMIFGALAQSWVDQLVARSDLILTDDYAPVDRLMGRTD